MAIAVFDSDYEKADAILTLAVNSDARIMMAQAIAVERERCASIADAAINEMNGQRKAGMARAIARRIRQPV